ncbi:MAG: DUF389 domain-containing protein [Thermoleophilaceae bacterium]|nr:DUF389 domain-containing protein [Thermoleophilaceae bacterium]
MLHLRIVAPPESAKQALGLLDASGSACNVIFLEGAARKPAGDVILADVAREDASILLSDLKELEIPRDGSIAIEEIDLELSAAADRAERHAPGLPSDAVVWEEVEARTSEQTELSISFVLFMVLAMQIAMVGIILDSTILIIGAMVVGPEFGPIAGFCVALVNRKGELARRSGRALLVGFPIGIVATILATLGLKWLGAVPDSYEDDGQKFTEFIANPDHFSFIVAALAGAAGMLSLTTAKSGALIGVLISVTTIPAAANIGVASAYENWSEAGGAAAQLAVNLGSIFAAGVLTLFIQRTFYLYRRRRHLDDPARAAAGLPEDQSKRTKEAVG